MRCLQAKIIKVKGGIVSGLKETSELHPPVEDYQEFQVGLNFCRETRVTTLLRVENLLGSF